VQSWSNTNDSLKSNKQINLEDIFCIKLQDLGARYNLQDLQWKHNKEEVY